MLRDPQTRVEFRRNASAGFSLIELLITVSIILIIAAIAIPNFLRSKLVANEASAVQNLRNITTAVAIYNETWDNGYPPALSSLGGTGTLATCDQSNLVDPLLSTAPYTKSGYVLGYVGQGGTVAVGQGCGNPGFWRYLITAAPQSKGLTGNRSFCSDSQGVIHYDYSGLPAGSESACEALTALQ